MKKTTMIHWQDNKGDIIEYKVGTCKYMRT